MRYTPRQVREFVPQIGYRNILAMAGPVRVLLLIFIIGVLVLIPFTQAWGPDWNYSQPNGEIGGVAISPKGDLIAVGAGKVLFFSRDGILIAQEPFGTDVRMTADGKYTASVYSSTVYYFENPLPAGSPDQQKATKLWDVELPEPVYSFDMNPDGSLIAGQTRGKNLIVLNTKTRLAGGNNRETDSVIKISGGGVIGISATKIHTYSASGNVTRTVNLTTNWEPRFMIIPSGSSAVINDGQAVRSVNIYTGKESWKRTLTGAVTALSMVPGGSLVVAGTEEGFIAGINANGNLAWNYASNTEDRQSAGITCSAVSDKGTTIAAGTADGKVLFLNSRGELTGSYAAREYIRHIAISADGSVTAAASDERMYVFSPGSSSVPSVTRSPSLTGTPVKITTVQSPSKTSVPLPSRQETLRVTPTELPTTYSVIRTATPSPPADITLLLSLALAVLIAGRKR